MKSSLFSFLNSRLRQAPLPGTSSQLKMAPKPKSTGVLKRKMDAPADADSSSVLLLLFANAKGQYELVITLRSRSINHGGQLSLPGGRAEEGETSVETALREASEEIGINPRDVNVAGQLSKLYVAHSDNYVTPVIGFLDYSPELQVNPDEVDEAFSVELNSLLDKKNLAIEDWHLRDEATYKVPYWNVHRVPLWGATAMILSEFLEIYREYKKQNSNGK